MKREFLEQTGKELDCLSGYALIYMTKAAKKPNLPIQLIDVEKDKKKLDFAILAKVTGENINQGIIVSSNIPDLMEGELVYLNHRYYPYPFIHNSIVFHRIQATDIICKVKGIDIDKKLEIEDGLGRDWNDEPIELTRKDVLT